jgi:hypothetical protein
MVTEDYNWRNWPACLVGRICCDALGGDFNVTHFLSERSGEARLSPTMMQLSDFIFEQCLMDLPLVRESFTWSNNQECPF